MTGTFRITLQGGITIDKVMDSTGCIADHGMDNRQSGSGPAQAGHQKPGAWCDLGADSGAGLFLRSAYLGQ